MLKPMPSDDRTHVVITEWLAFYIAQPHPQLGRAGPVCPFVAKSMRCNGTVVMSWVFESEPDITGARGAVYLGMDRFENLARQAPDPDSVSLIVAFPDLGREQWHLIDDLHRECKTAAVRRGLMLGQFHPACDAPAAHNPGFPVNRSPVPLVVIRNMSEHDILFLQGNPEWLKHYERAVGRVTT